MRDENGIKIKPGHTGHRGPPVGPWTWLVRRHDDKCFGPFENRHEAIGWIARRRDVQDYEPVAIPVGSFRFDDVVRV